MTDRLTLLCVDDDPDIRTVALMALGLDAGIQAQAASGGAEALQWLRREELRPDAILLDVMMPEMDGPAVLAEIRAMPEFQDLPVIFMTARARQQDVAHYRALGANGVIVKPFDPLHLAEDVRALLSSTMRRR